MKNSRKKHVLAILSYAENPYTAKEITELCYPITLNSICASLKNYHRQGLVARKKQNDKFVYWITEKGQDRLEWLLGSNSIKEQIDLLVREPIRNIYRKKDYE